MARTRTVSGDDVKAAESGGFALYAAGDYIGEIKDVKAVKFGKPGTANAKMEALNVTIQITESSTGEGIGKKFIAWQVPDEPKFASGSAAFLHFQFYKALGFVFPKAGESGEVDYPDLVDLLGQEIGFTLQIIPEDEAKGYKAKNKVSKFFAASDGITASEPTETDEEFKL